MWFEKLLEYVVTPSVIVIVIGFVARSLFSQILVKDLERFKLKLQSENDLARTRLENDLRIRLFDFQTRFSLFHQQRAEVIKELYALLSDTHDTLVNLTRMVQIRGKESLEERKRETATVHGILKKYYRQNLIFLKNEICSEIESIVDLMRRAFIDFDIAQDGSEYKPDRTGLWKKAWDMIAIELPPLLQHLEEELRMILSGVTPNQD